MAFSLTHCSPPSKDSRVQSPHFKDGKFHNPASTNKTWFKVFKMLLTNKWADWPHWVDSPEGPTPEPRLGNGEYQVTLINHSTVLIQLEGLNILTDPIYSDRCSPVSFAGPKRVRAPAIAFDKLPPIDIVLISHDHYDHLDLPTLKKIRKRDNPKIYMGLGVASRFNNTQNLIEMDWWQESPFNSNLKVHFVPVQHFSGRSLFDRNSTLWGGFVLQFKNKNIYFGGDSGYADHYQKTFEKLGPMDFSILPIGAYEPRNFMAYAHMNPKDALKAHQDLKSKQSMGIHYGTFQLTAEPIDEPVDKLQLESEKLGMAENEFLTLEFGKAFKLFKAH